MDFIKQVLKICLGIGLIVVLVNDIGRYALASYTAGNLARQAAELSAAEARRTGMNREASWRAAENLAQQTGSTVYGYDIQGERTHVWVRVPVKDTVLLQRAVAIMSSEPATTPLTVEDENQALIQ